MKTQHTKRNNQNTESNKTKVKQTNKTLPKQQICKQSDNRTNTNITNNQDAIKNKQNKHKQKHSTPMKTEQPTSQQKQTGEPQAKNNNKGLKTQSENKSNKTINTPSKHQYKN